MTTIDKTRTKRISIQAADSLVKLLEVTNQGLDSFSFVDFSKQSKSKMFAIMSFNELSSVNMFYPVVRNTQDCHKNIDRYLINPLVCAEYLVNHNPDLIIGKRFYRFDTNDISVYGGFIEDESNLNEQVKLQVLQITGVVLDCVYPQSITAVEVTGEFSLIEDYQKHVVFKEDEQYQWSPETEQDIVESISMNYKPRFNVLAKEKKEERGLSKKKVQEVLCVGVEMAPQYSVFGPSSVSYEWSTSQGYTNSFPEVQS